MKPIDKNGKHDDFREYSNLAEGMRRETEKNRAIMCPPGVPIVNTLRIFNPKNIIEHN